MPRGRLNEKHVQQVALSQLALRYRSRAGVQAVIAKSEVRVSKHSEFGFGRADGLAIREPTSGLEPLTSSLTSDNSSVAGACRSLQNPHS